MNFDISNPLPTNSTAGWMGGPESDGIWTGTSLNTTFTPGPGNGKPFGGLLSFYLDVGTSGQWNRHNATQRLGVGPYILWTYVPSIVSVLYGVLWQLVDGEVKRIEKYRELAQEGGCSARRTLCFDYHSFWTPLSILQGLRYKQWPVVCSSTGYVLAAIVVPNVQNYVFSWDTYSGAELAWGGQYSWQIAYADPYWSKILIGILVADLVCAVGLVFTLWKRSTCLTEDPRGIAFATSLILETGPKIEPNFTSGWTLNNPDQKYKLEANDGHLQLIPVMDTSTTSLTQNTQQSKKNTLKAAWAGIKTITRELWKQLSSRLNLLEEFLGRPTIRQYTDLGMLILWNGILLVILFGTVWVLSQMTSNAVREAQNYRLPWSPNLYLVVGVFLQVIHH